MTAGNCAADEAAKAARDRENSDILQALNRLRAWETNHSHEYSCVLRYLAEASRMRMHLMPKKQLSNHPDNNQGLVEDSAGQDHAPQIAFDVLSNWDPQGPYFLCDLGDISDEILQAVSGGTKFAWAVWCWLSQLRWIQSNDPHSKSDSDYGVTWIELFTNFLTTTGVSVPIFVEQHTITPTWVWPDSDAASLLPLKLRCVAAQIAIFEGCVRQLQTLTGKRAVWGPRGKPPSLWHLGFFQRKNGFLRRPILPFACQTMGHLRNFLRSCSPSFHDVWNNGEPGLNPPPLRDVADLSPRARRKHYEGILRTLRN